MTRSFAVIAEHKNKFANKHWRFAIGLTFTDSTATIAYTDKAGISYNTETLDLNEWRVYAVPNISNGRRYASEGYTPTPQPEPTGTIPNGWYRITTATAGADSFGLGTTALLGYGSPADGRCIVAADPAKRTFDTFYYVTNLGNDIITLTDIRGRLLGAFDRSGAYAAGTVCNLVKTGDVISGYQYPILTKWHVIPNGEYFNLECINDTVPDRPLKLVYPLQYANIPYFMVSTEPLGNTVGVADFTFSHTPLSDVEPLLDNGFYAIRMNSLDASQDGKVASSYTTGDIHFETFPGDITQPFSFSQYGVYVWELKDGIIDKHIATHSGFNVGFPYNSVQGSERSISARISAAYTEFSVYNWAGQKPIYVNGDFVLGVDDYDASNLVLGGTTGYASDAHTDVYTGRGDIPQNPRWLYQYVELIPVTSSD